jgi:hypothetical protein
MRTRMLSHLRCARNLSSRDTNRMHTIAAKGSTRTTKVSTANLVSVLLEIQTAAFLIKTWDSAETLPGN